MLTAAAAWDDLAEGLRSAAASVHLVSGNLTGAAWLGPSSALMAAAVAPYTAWLATTAALCEQTATQARAAAAAYEAAFAMTVHPAMIAANRSQLTLLITTNILSQNTPAIAATEAHYGQMWAQDAAAMYEYANASAAASALTPFTSPPPTTNSPGTAAQVGAVAHASATSADAASLPSFLQLLSLLSPVNLAVSSASTAITSTGMAGSYAGLAYAVHYDPEGAEKLDAILARLGTLPENPPIGASTSSLPENAWRSGNSASVLSAYRGRAPSIGALSVPPSWTAATPPISLVRAAWPNTLSGPAAPVVTASLENAGSERVSATLPIRCVSGANPRVRPSINTTFTPNRRVSFNWG